jgi:hypothetical protein
MTHMEQLERFNELVIAAINQWGREGGDNAQPHVGGLLLGVVAAILDSLPDGPKQECGYTAIAFLAAALQLEGLLEERGTRH